MPLISDESLKSKLEHPSNIAASLPSSPSQSPVVLPLYRGGRRNGDENLSPLARTLIGAFSQIEGTKAAAETFSVSQVHANNLKKGEVNGMYKDPEHAKSVDAVVDQVNGKALNILMNSLGLIETPESTSELAGLPLRQKAAFAKDVASIVGSIKKQESPITNNGQIVMYAPKMENMENLLVHATVVAK